MRSSVAPRERPEVKSMHRSKKCRPPQRPPTTPAEDVKKAGVLSEKWGGKRRVRTYCLFYYTRPADITEFMTCFGHVDEVTGTRFTNRCPDFLRCISNPGKAGIKKKPYDNVSLRELQLQIPGDPNTRPKQADPPPSPAPRGRRGKGPKS